MNDPKLPAIGCVPSLEVLPFFVDSFFTHVPFWPVTFSSYGRIARDLLTGQLDAGILPWEIFIADMLALPGERANWCVELFIHPCPTEFVLSNHQHRHFYPAKPTSTVKLPPLLVIGVESRNSLTRHQLHDWHARHHEGKLSDVIFKMLPMDLMVRGLAAEAIDGFIAPAPWGDLAQQQGKGKAVHQFKPGKYTQKLILVSRRHSAQHLASAPAMIDALTKARLELSKSDVFQEACMRLAASGKPRLDTKLLENATRIHASGDSLIDTIPCVDFLTSALTQLKNLAVLPPQVACNESTARLLLPSGI